MKIGGLEIEGKYIMPAIAGYSDVGQRALAYRYGAALTFTEMISAKGLVYGSNHTADLLATTEAEPFKCVQLFGSEPEFIRRAVLHPAIKKFDLIDINCGCPVHKIVGNGEGSALLKDIPLLKEIVAAAAEAAAPRPVTVKMRLGFSKGELLSPAAAAAAEEAGAAAITVHGRRREDFYSGAVDLDGIRETKNAVSVPVFANGDIVDIASAERALEVTGCDGAAIARGALGRPYVFSELNGIPVRVNPGELVKEHFSMILKVYPERVATDMMKKHFVYYSKGVRGGKAVKAAAFAAKNASDLNEAAEMLSRQFLCENDAADCR